MCKKILVADDDKAMRIFYKRMFAGHDYAITLAESVKEAADLIEANTYDLLITDYMLDDGLGTDLIRLFNEKRPKAKCLLVSGSLEADEALTRAETAHFMRKPFDIGKLMAVVAHAVV